MALSKNNRKWLWVPLLGVPLLGVATCAGLFGVGFAIAEYSPRPEPTEAELAVVLHANEVAQALGRDPGDPTLDIDRIDVMGIMPRLSATSRAADLTVRTEVKAETSDRVDNDISGATVAVTMGVAEDLGPLPTWDLQHLWIVTGGDDEVEHTSVFTIHGDNAVEWSINGAQIRDAAVLRTLLADELEAFRTLPW